MKRERPTTPILILLFLSACGEVEVGPHPNYREGPPPGRLLVPGASSGKALEVFWELPGCAGEGFIAGSGERFSYGSVEVDGACFEESGSGYGP